MKKVGAVSETKQLICPVEVDAQLESAPYLVTDDVVRPRRRLCLMGGPVTG